MTEIAKTPAAVADEAAEAIRQLNHMTMPGRADLEWPSDVYIVIGDLMVMAERLPQLLRQLSKWLYREYEAGRVGHDTSPDPLPCLHGVGDGLQAAFDAAEALRRGLARAHNASSHLTGLDNNEEG